MSISNSKSMFRTPKFDSNKTLTSSSVAVSKSKNKGSVVSTSRTISSSSGTILYPSSDCTSVSGLVSISALVSKSIVSPIVLRDVSAVE